MAVPPKISQTGKCKAKQLAKDVIKHSKMFNLFEGKTRRYLGISASTSIET